MDEALLGGRREAGGSGSGGAGWDRKRLFDRRSDAIAHGSTYQKAAALVDLAEDGIGIPEEILDQSSFGTSLNSYLMFSRFDFLWTVNYFALIALNFLEKPLWCTENCNNRDYYFLGELPFLTTAESLVYEGVTLLILVVHILFPVSYEGFNIFWKSVLNRLKVLFLVILIVDLSVYIVYLSPAAFDTLPFRIAPYIRVVFFILNIRDIRDSIIILYGMLGTYLNVMALLLLFLLFSSWLAYVIFEDTEQGKTTFTSYGVTLYEMFILFTTSNNPDVWIPAYKQSRWNVLFFVVFVLLGVYFVTNLILAVVYDSFKGELVKQVAEKDRTRTRVLKKAFNLIDENELGYLDKDQCIRLFAELNKYRTLPKISREDFELIFYELDDSHDVKINLEEFVDLSHAIGLRFQKEESEPVFRNCCPTFYNSYASEKIKEFVRSAIFNYIVAFILILNFVAVVIETTLDIEDNSAQDAWQKLEFVFGWIYVLEMALKVYAYGFENYWRDGQNRFDFIITWVIVIGETATFITPTGGSFLSNGEWIRYLLIARMLRLIRLLMHVPQYRAFVATFFTLIPSLMPYLGTIFCVMCVYCSLGVQIFGGVVYDGNMDLDRTDLKDNDYLLFNFNDYPNGMVTLFNLLVMGNWQAWMQSYKELTGTAWVYVYFISFYLITVLLLLNLVVAFVLEAFFAEMELEASDKSEEVDVKDDNGKERRRRLGAKSRNQRVDMLLHHMLSAELKTTECSEA
ncbi:two pore calcium channel protein 1A [Andrographis paniculata]|uniref:two pore calcium channel protein 1A n=1 Tax=Andrographis paniculata TaxID=175694 RepID=UPI0021E860F7|nr:two pore calcium channel protein 1A [Andrographis paniculata]